MEYSFEESQSSPDRGRRVVRGNSQRWQARVEAHPWGCTGIGPLGTLDYRLFFMDRQRRGEISPLHDIPCYHRDALIHIVCKTPQGSRAEYQVSEDEHQTPLRRSVRWDQPAFFAHDAIGNFGFIPQTYADPTSPNEDYGGLPYDGQPLEFMDIGSRKRKTGHVYAVKPLCAFAVVSHNVSSISWKLVGIAADDPLADQLHNSSDIVQFLPGKLQSVREWFRICHCVDPEDKESLFGFNERPTELNVCLPLISQAHEAWRSRKECQSTMLPLNSDLPLNRPMSPVSVLDVPKSVMSRVHVLTLEPSNQFSNHMDRCGVREPSHDDIPLFTRNESLGSESSSSDFTDGYRSDASSEKRRKGKGKRVSWGWVETREIPARSLPSPSSHPEQLSEMDRVKLALSAMSKRSGSDSSRQRNAAQPPSLSTTEDIESWHRKSWESMKKKYLLNGPPSPSSPACHPLNHNAGFSRAVCYSH